MDSIHSSHLERLDPRKEQILALVVREHIRTAEPVGSKHLEQGCGFSAATIRNEMAALTDAGFLSQPHTSAGRVPTEAAYRYYIEHSLTDAAPDLRDFRAVLEDRDSEDQKLRHMARILAREAQGSVFVSTDDALYVTGLSFLFGHPEFHSPDFLRDVTGVLDALEERMTDLLTYSREPLTVMLGSENPLHGECSTMMLRTLSSNEAPVVFGVLGPLRMDYDHVMPLLHGIRKLMQE